VQGHNPQTGRFFYLTDAIPGGMNVAQPLRTLTDGEASYILGCLSSYGHLLPGFEASTQQYAPAGAWAGFTQNIRHMFRYYGATDTLVLLGNTKIWVQTTGVPIEKTPAIALTTTTRWKGRTLVDANLPVAVINNYGLDVPHYWGGGSGLFIPIPNAPKTKAFCGWLGRMLNGNVYDTAWYMNRLWWSGINDLTDYTSLSSGYLDLEGESDAILNLEVTTGNVVLIFRRKSIYLGVPISFVENPIGSQYLSSYGLLAPDSVQRAGVDFFYLGDSDVYAISQYDAPVSIGVKVRKEIFALADPAHISEAWSFLDSMNKLYYLIITLKDATTRAWIFNFEQKSWTTQNFTGIFSLGTWHA